MNFFEKILSALDGQMAKPTPYGWFHLLFLGLMICATVLVILICKKISSKKFRLITLIVAIVLIVLELYKQLNYSYTPSTDTWSYQWYAFPFQFCSTPMYILLLIGILKENKLSKWLCSFMGTFGLFAGLIVMFYPNTVFVSTVGINIQTMIHHGAMFVMGVFMHITGRVEYKHKTMLKAMAVFGVLCLSALLMDIVWHFVGINQTFNMFFISPYYKCELVILDKIQEINYFLFLVSYLFGFSLAGYIVLLCAMGIRKLSHIVSSKKTAVTQTANTDAKEIKNEQEFPKEQENSEVKEN